MSTLKVNTIQNTSGVEVYTAKAWVNFNGSGTVAIRASGNVSSITDNNNGDFTVNFTNAMSDVNYSVCGFTGQPDSTGVNASVGVGATGNNTTSQQQYLTTGSVRVLAQNSGGANINPDFVSVAIFR